MKVKRLDHVGVIVDDLDETARLLTGELGLAPERSEDPPTCGSRSSRPVGRGSS